MIIKAVNENRLLKVIISIILCLTVTAFTILMKCEEVYAIAVALPLIGAGLLIAAGILVMAGLSFESEEQATIASNQWFYDLCSNHKLGRMCGIGKEERQKALTDFWDMKESSEEVKTVTDDLWNYTKAWVNETYDVGENDINRDVYAVVDEYGDFVTYCLNSDDRVLLGDAILWNGVLLEWKYLYQQGGYYIYELLEDGESIGYNPYLGYGRIERMDYEDSPQFYVRGTTDNKLALDYEYVRDNEVKTSSLSFGVVVAPLLSGYEEQISAAWALKEEIDYNIAAIGAVDVVDNPAWDYETDDGNRSIYVPTEGTIEDYVGLTYDELLDITNQAIAGEAEPGIDDEEKTWWQELVGGVSAKIEEGAQLLVGTLAELKAWLDGTYQNIIGSVNEAAASIEDTIEAQQAEDIEPILQGFSITNLMILFLDVLLACIRLVIRACMYLATIVAIPPDGTLLNNDTQSGLDFFKNQVIPVINISIWDMYSGLMTLVISLAVVKRVRRIAE